jgi:hypothetical protein
MLYVGYVVSVEEALRLLKLDESLVTSFYDTKPIQKYLNEKKSELVFRYIDKGACLFGVALELEDPKTNFPYSNIEDTLFQILLAKHAFQQGTEQLGIDTSFVNLTWVESDEKKVENPRPYVISL